MSNARLLLWLCLSWLRASVRRDCAYHTSHQQQDLVGSSHPCAQYDCTMLWCLYLKNCGMIPHPWKYCPPLELIFFSLFSPSVSILFCILPNISYDMSILLWFYIAYSIVGWCTNKHHLLYRGGVLRSLLWILKQHITCSLLVLLGGSRYLTRATININP